jgi:hypothetical protein
VNIAVRVRNGSGEGRDDSVARIAGGGRDAGSNSRAIRGDGSKESLLIASVSKVHSSMARWIELTVIAPEAVAVTSVDTLSVALPDTLAVRLAPPLPPPELV